MPGWPINERIQGGKSLAAQTKPSEWMMIRRALNSLVSGTHIGIVVNASVDGTLQLVSTAENLVPAPTEDFAVLYGFNGVWVEVEPDTDGHHLTTHSTTGPPTWEDPQGSGGEVPNAATEGDILYDDGGDWVVLGFGTAGQLLQTNGEAAPTWVNSPFTGGVQGDILYHNGTSFVKLAAGNAPSAPFTDLKEGLLRTGGAGANPEWVDRVTFPFNVTGGEIMAFDDDAGGGPPLPRWKIVLAGAAGSILQTGTVGSVPLWISKALVLAGALEGLGDGYVRFNDSTDTVITNNRIPETDLFIDATTSAKELIFTNTTGAQPVLTHAPIGEVIAQADGTGTASQILETFDDGGTPNVRWIDPPTGTVAAAGTLGRILYDDGAAWVALAIGTAGQRLTSQGGAAPTWETENALPAGVIGDVLIHNGTSYISLNPDTNFKVLTTKGAGNATIWDFLRAH